LHFAIQQNACDDIVMLLIKKGASLDVRDKENKSPIDYITNNELKQKIINNVKSIENILNKETHSENNKINNEVKPFKVVDVEVQAKSNDKIPYKYTNLEHTKTVYQSSENFNFLDNINIEINEKLDSEEDKYTGGLDENVKDQPHFIKTNNRNLINNTINKNNNIGNNNNTNDLEKTKLNSNYNTVGTVGSLNKDNKENKDNKDSVSKNSKPHSRDISINQLSELNPLDTNK